MGRAAADTGVHDAGEQGEKIKKAPWCIPFLVLFVSRWILPLRVGRVIVDADI